MSLSIKQISISGFRSFRSTAEIEPFSPRHNAVVGRNGSGKSNFFDAIEFVLLSPRFYTLRQEERQQLLHEGAGANVMSAYVEIVFNNADGRLPVDGAEVTLRRALGAKKDEYFVNGRRQQRREVEGLLESAGFSRANPYYIVQQGKVSALCLMPDEERLVLLKNIGGAAVYEERRKESVQQLSDMEAKRSNIASVISGIESRIGELEGEKEELQLYERLDREHRALTYSLYDQELQKVRAQVDALDEAREAEAAAGGAAHDDHLRADAEHRAADAAARAAAASSQRARDAAHAVDARRADKLRLGARARAELAEHRALGATDERRRRRCRARLGRVAAQIRAARADAAANAQRLAAARAAAAELNASEWTGADVAELEAGAESKRGALRRVAAELEASKKRKADLVDELGARHADAAQLDRDAAALEGAAPAAAVAEKRRAVGTAQAALDALDDSATDGAQAVARAEAHLKALMPPPISRGLACLEKALKADAGMRSKHHGTVIEHVVLSDGKYRTAVEVAAGPQLWHVIVDDDDAAAAAVRRLEREGGGRLTFIPVNRVRAEGGDAGAGIPDDARGDVAALVDVALELPEAAAAARAALRSVFGRKLLARTADAAQRYSKLLRRDAITLEGDQTSKRGATEGGWRAPADSALGALAALREARAAREAGEANRATCRAAVAAARDALASAETAASGTEARRTHLRHAAAQARHDHDALARNARDVDDAVRRSERAVDGAQRGLALLEARVARESDRRASRALQGAADLSPDELARRRAAAASELATAETRGAQLEAALRDHLLKQRDDLRARLGLVAVFGDDADDADDESGEATLDETAEEEDDDDDDDLAMGAEEDFATEASSGAARLDVAARAERCAALEAELEAADGDLERDDAELRRSEGAAAEWEAALVREQARLDDAAAAVEAASDAVAAAARAAERHVSRRQVLVSRREEKMRKMRHVGTLPEREVASYKHLAIRELLAQLEQCNAARRAIAHVNKKALDQYVNFSEQRTALLERQTELDVSRSKIEELVANLDAKKDEAIDRTFRGVSRHFTDVFRELVPQGEAKLVMVKRDAPRLQDTSNLDETQDDDDDDEASGTPASGRKRKRRNRGAPGAFQGVAIAVRFPGSSDSYSMAQLSGGQKALVALSLIFAIQRLDPAPFYLFDEIDAALDATHRAAVAALVQRQANSPDKPAQFITTTFRPEFVRAADAHYGISLAHKTSHAHRITKQEALRFVAENDADDEDAANA